MADNNDQNTTPQGSGETADTGTQKATSSTDTTDTGDAGADAATLEPAADWHTAFPDKTPEDVQNELQQWKTHSRDWEKKAKDWKKQVEKRTPDNNIDVDGLTTQLEQTRSENLMFRDLIAMEIEHGTPVPISELADSIAFRDAYANLDRTTDDFAEKLKELVDKRAGKQPPAQQRWVETTGTTSAGDDLYKRMFNTN